MIYVIVSAISFVSSDGTTSTFEAMLSIISKE